MSDTNPSTGSPKTATPLWIKITLAVSLALNLLIAGAVLGAVLSPDGPRGSRIDSAGRDVGAAPFVRALEPQDRRALFRSLRSQAEPLARNRDELRLRFDALLAALRADPFDAAELQSLLALQRSAAVSRQEIGERVLVERLGQMSPADRSAYADRLDAAVRKGFGERPPQR